VRKILLLLTLAALTNAPAAPLPSSPTRTSPQDLEVFDIGPGGQKSASRFYTYTQLGSLPQVTLPTKQDPNTMAPATYTGVYLRDLFAALGAPAGADVLGSNCYDNYKDYYDPAYIQHHQPLLILKYDGKPPAEWPAVEGGMPFGPYCVGQVNFVPADHLLGYTEPPRIPFGVVSLELTTLHQAYDSFAPKKDATDPQVIAGHRIAMGSCVMCHYTDVAGGLKSNQPWTILAVFATSNGSYFRDYVVNPLKFNPKSAMPVHPTFDAKTLDALQAYFKTMQ
jgi:hypothetical protein